MKTFEGVPVPPIDEILERTLYVKTKNAEIERLAEENEQLRRRLEEAGDYVAANINLHTIVIAQADTELALRRQLEDETEQHKNEWSRAQRFAAESERLRNENARITISARACQAAYHRLTVEAEQLRRQLAAAQAEAQPK